MDAPRGVAEAGWADVIARIFVTASLIACAIPALFFLIVSEAEANIVIGTIRTYIRQRCALLRPWIPAGYGSDRLLTPPPFKGTHAIHKRNDYLRLLAFQSGILVLAILLSSGLAVWYWFGRLPLVDIMGRAFFYTLVFCATELAFVVVITRMPLLDNTALDLAIIDHVIEQGRACPAARV